MNTLKDSESALASGTGHRPRGLRRVWAWVRGRVWRRPGNRWQARDVVRRTVNIESLAAALEEAVDPVGAKARAAASVAPPSAEQLSAVIRKGLTEIPPLPHVVRELLKELSDPASTARSVARIATTDPALAAALIRTVNSAAMGLRRRVTSVAEAVSYLGYSAVRSLVIRLRLETVLPTRSGKAGYDSEDLWIHSLAVAHAADCLAEQAKVPGVDKGFVATLGLLHDIGKLAINCYFPESAEALKQRSPDRPDESFLDRERRVLGADHAEIGALLATHWKLPSELVEAIRWHHSPQSMPVSLPDEVRAAAALVHMANQIAKYCYVYSEDVEIDILPEDLFRGVGLAGPIKRLMTGKMCRAISRAIFFADASRTKPLNAIRRFARLFDETRAKTMLIGASRTEPRVKLADDEGDAMFAAECTVIEPAKRWRGKSPGVTWKRDRQVRFTGRLNDEVVEQLLESILGHQDTLDLSEDARLAAKFLARRLLPNLLEVAAGEKVEIAQSLTGGTFVLAIRSPALAFDKRLGLRTRTGTTARRVLEMEFANVINLRWFREIRCSRSGDTLIFISHAIAK